MLRNADDSVIPGQVSCALAAIHATLADAPLLASGPSL